MIPLKSRLLGKSLIWMTLNSVTRFILVILGFVVLARVLRPEDFGQAALVFSIVGLANSIFEGGIKQFTIVHSDRNFLTTCKILKCLPKLIIFRCVLLLLLLALVGANLHLGVGWFSIILGLLWMVTSTFAASFAALIESDFGFGRVFAVEIPAYALGYLLVAYLAGVCGLGVNALLLAALSQSLLMFMGFFALSRKVRGAVALPESNVDEFSEVFRKMGVVRLLNYTFMNVDYWFIGGFVGAYSLGIYERSFKILNAPITLGMGIVERVFLPFLAVSYDGEKREAGIGFWVCFQLIFLSLSVALLQSVYHHVEILLPDNGWEGVVSVLSSLIYLAPAKVMMKFYDTYFRSQKWLSRIWRVKLISLTLLLLALVITAGDGLDVIVNGIVFAYTCSFVVYALAVTLRSGRDWSRYLALFPPLLYAGYCYSCFYA